MTPQDPIYSLPTNVGAAKLAYAMANQLTVDISHMAIGDGNGVAVNPTAAWPSLAREVHRAQLNQLYQHPTNPNWLVAELVLPAEVGGWTIREIALYDVDGDLIFIGNHAEQYKPVQSQGSDETKTIRMVILVSNTSAVTLKTDPTTVMATVDYVQRELAKLDHKQSVRYTTTAAVVLSGLGVQAGGDWAAALTAGDRVLVKNQALAKDNGIYVAAGGAWARAADADESVEVTSGLVIAVEQGASLADTRWQLVTDGSIILGTTALVFQDVTKGYAPLASPAFTGSPSAPTPPQFENSEIVATTRFVQRALGNYQKQLQFNSSQVLTAAQCGSVVIGFGTSTIGFTLPAWANCPDGAAFDFWSNNTSAGGVTIACAGADFFQMNAGTSGAIALGAGDSFFVVKGSAPGQWIALGGTKSLQNSPGFAASLGNPGWRKLPSGEIEQWATQTLGAVGAYNQQSIGGTTFYTNYYNVTYPLAFPNVVHEAEVTLACSTFAAQISMAGNGASLNLSGTGNSLTGMGVAITTPILGFVPTIHWRSRGK